MAINSQPLVALGIRTDYPAPDLIGNQVKLSALAGQRQQQAIQAQQAPLIQQGLQQQNQAQQLQNEAAQRQAQHEQALQTLWNNPTPPSDEDIMKAAGPIYGSKILETRLGIQEKKGNIQKATDEHQSAVADHVANIANGIKSQGYDLGNADTILAGEQNNPDPDYSKAVTQMRMAIRQNPGSLKQIVDQALAQSHEQQTQQTTLGAAKIRAEGHPAEGELPLQPEELEQINPALAKLAQIAYPGQPVSPEFQLRPGATQKDFSRVDALLGKLQSAQATQANQQATAAQRQFTNQLATQNQQDREAKKAQPSADEIRRSDLANNLNENLDKFEDIVKRRPELFGPVAGRLTAMREWTGTSDPDIAALKTIHEQVGMATLGAHSMRSAQHVEAAADAIMNGYKNEPQAILSSIGTARNSLKTFIGDVQGQPIRSAGTPATPRPMPGKSSQAFPSKGATKTNSHGDTLTSDGNKWVLTKVAE